MRIGIITAMAEEMLPIYLELGNVTAQSKIHGALVRKIELADDTLYLATCGVGEINAATTAQLLVDLFDIEVLLNFGFVGTLKANIAVGGDRQGYEKSCRCKRRCVCGKLDAEEEACRRIWLRYM